MSQPVMCAGRFQVTQSSGRFPKYIYIFGSNMIDQKSQWTSSSLPPLLGMRGGQTLQMAPNYPLFLVLIPLDNPLPLSMDGADQCF